MGTSEVVADHYVELAARIASPTDGPAKVLALRPRGSGRRVRHLLAAISVREVLCLYREQTVEKRSIAAQGLAQVFGRDVVAPGPFFFELGPFSCKRFRQLLDSRCYQFVSLLHRNSRVIDESGLDGFPSGPHVRRII